MQLPDFLHAKSVHFFRGHGVELLQGRSIGICHCGVRRLFRLRFLAGRGDLDFDLSLFRH